MGMLVCYFMIGDFDVIAFSNFICVLYSDIKYILASCFNFVNRIGEWLRWLSEWQFCHYDGSVID